MICVAVLLANANTFRVPFLFDDAASIADNPTIHRLSARVFSPPHGTGVTVEGRPVLNASLAFNYAVSGTQVWSYHVVNLALHAASALLLFGLVHRTLRGTGAALPASLSIRATEIAAATALLWALHPLQTESVTYIVQRAESLMGFFYLLTLYAFVRGATSNDGGGRRWFVFSCAACALGMGTKEVMVSAPLIVWLYDRTFIAGSFGEAWRRRRMIHVALAFTWLVLAWCVAQSGLRGGTIGAGSGVTWWGYACCQARGIIHYLGLAVWPRKLVFDYGSDFVTFAEILPFGVLVIALLGATIYALRRRPALGFVGAWFFAILAPTSSFLGGTRQMLAEHRMYLSLAAVAVLAVLGVQRMLARRAWIVWTAFALLLGLLTLRRNADYRSEVAIYRDTVAKRPQNGFAHNNLGKALLNTGRAEEAVAEFRLALELAPTRVMAHSNLAAALARLGRHEEARTHAAAAVQLNPRNAEASFNLGTTLLREGQATAAIPHFEQALRVRPDYPEALCNLGTALQQSGRPADAIARYERAVALKPDYAEAYYSLGLALASQHRAREALERYRAALRLRPDYADALAGLGALLVEAQQFRDAISQLEAALRLAPSHLQAHLQLGHALTATGRAAEAIPHYETVVRAEPNNAEYHHNLGGALFEGSNRADDAIAEFNTALRLNPNAAETHANLGLVLASRGRRAEAIQHLETAVRLRPDLQFARDELARLRARQ